MKWEELKNKSKKELREIITEARNELRSLLFQTHSRQLKQVHKIDVAKKTIARASMALRDDKQKTS